MIDYYQNHIRRVLKTNGVKTAFTFDELSTYINVYLNDPSIDKKGRNTIFKNEMGPYHGNAGKKIAEQILSFIS